MSSIFGGSQSATNSNNNSVSNSNSTSASQSNNQAYPMLNQALGGQVTNGTNAGNGISAMLGLGGDPAAQNQAFQNFRNSTGYQFGLDQGAGAITGSAATKGLLNSGATAKALDTYGQNYANTQYQNYTNLLSGQQNAGNQAAGVISGAGQQSTSNSNSNSAANSAGTSNGGSSSKPGIGGFLGALL